MALHYRKRGDVWHCRGSVRIGRRRFPVREFSTGCTTKVEAQAVGAAEEARIRDEGISDRPCQSRLCRQRRRALDVIPARRR